MTIPYFDAHCDTISRIATDPERHLTRYTDQWDLDRMEVYSGKKAQIFAVYRDSALPGMTEMVRAEFAAFQNECERYSHRMTHCRTAQQAEQAFAEGKLAAFLSVEGAELLDCSLERLRWAYEIGVRAVNLTWNHANLLSGSHKEESDRGLSEQGRAFVKEMDRLGMIVDVSHLSDPGFWDVLEVSKNPIMASHSNARDVFFHTRNLTDAQITAIIKNQGIVGLNCFVSFLGDGHVTMETLRRHMDRMLELGGEKTVALGGDWDGCYPLPEGFSGAWNWRDFYEYLSAKNYPDTLLQDLFFNNLMRIVREVCTI